MCHWMQSLSILTEIMWMKPHAAITCQNKLTANLLSVGEYFSPPPPHGFWSYPQRNTVKVLRKWLGEWKFLSPVATEHLCLHNNTSFVACYNFSCASPQLTTPCCSGDNYPCVSLSVPQGQTTLSPLPLLTTPSAPQVPTTLLPLTKCLT